MVFSKCILLCIVAASFVAYSQGNPDKIETDPLIYKNISIALAIKHPDDPELVKCISDDFEKSKVADKFYTKELLNNTTQLLEEIKPYEKWAEPKCEIALFLQTPIGILIMCLILLVLILICCGVIRCLWC